MQILFLKSNYISRMKIRKATFKDCEAILALITELAIYEKAGDEVSIDLKQLQSDGFGENPLFQAFVAENNDEIAGMALVYFKYSTWKGKSLYLEDIVVKSKFRRMGIGEMLFKKVVSYGLESNCARMDWQVLDWNLPAISFYKKLYAELDETWINGRLFPETMRKILE